METLVSHLEILNVELGGMTGLVLRFLSGRALERQMEQRRYHYLPNLISSPFS
jgi:hypothetical protein